MAEVTAVGRGDRSSGVRVTQVLAARARLTGLQAEYGQVSALVQVLLADDVRRDLDEDGPPSHPGLGLVVVPGKARAGRRRGAHPSEAVSDLVICDVP